MHDTMKRLFKATQIKHMSPTAQEEGKPQPPLFKAYEGERIHLPKPESSTPSISLHDAITKRRSHRKFNRESLTLEHLSYALWATQGIMRQIHDRATLRTVPSAGARHAFETWILVNHMETLKAGLYAYEPASHALVMLQASDTLGETLAAACLGQKMVAHASVSFFWIADIERMTYRYGERGFRYLCMDAGHVCQNLYLVAEALDLGTCAIGAYDDDAVNQALGLDAERECVLYIAPLGVIDR